MNINIAIGIILVIIIIMAKYLLRWSKRKTEVAAREESEVKINSGSLLINKRRLDETMLSPAPSTAPSTGRVEIIEYLHESLTEEWKTVYTDTINNLKSVIPLNNIYYNKVTVYAWDEDLDTLPYTGVPLAQGLHGGTQNLKMILAIGMQVNNVHSKAVIAHEYFHLYQKTLNNNMNTQVGFPIKWIVEGTAATFESIYTVQYHDSNQFSGQLSHSTAEILSNPSINEINSTKDPNYGSSIFMILVLVKELINLGHTEIAAFKLVLNTYLHNQLDSTNWKTLFQTTFGFSVEIFYDRVKNYSKTELIPSPDITIQQIFN